MQCNYNIPNMLLMQVDKMMAKSLSVYGHPLSKAPHIEQLAWDDMVFQNIYCNFSLYAPSRWFSEDRVMSSRVAVLRRGRECSLDVQHVTLCLPIGAARIGA